MATEKPLHVHSNPFNLHWYDYSKLIPIFIQRRAEKFNSGAELGPSGSPNQFIRAYREWKLKTPRLFSSSIWPFERPKRFIIDLSRNQNRALKNEKHEKLSRSATAECLMFAIGFRPVRLVRTFHKPLSNTFRLQRSRSACWGVILFFANEIISNFTRVHRYRRHYATANYPWDSAVLYGAGRCSRVGERCLLSTHRGASTSNVNNIQSKVISRYSPLHRSWISIRCYWISSTCAESIQMRICACWSMRSSRKCIPHIMAHINKTNLRDLSSSALWEEFLWWFECSMRLNSDS